MLVLLFGMWKLLWAIAGDSFDNNKTSNEENRWINIIHWCTVLHVCYSVQQTEKSTLILPAFAKMQVMNFSSSKCMTFHITVHHANIIQAWMRTNGECWLPFDGLECAWHKKIHWIRLISLLLEPNHNVNNEEWSHQCFNNISSWCSLWFAWYISKSYHLTLLCHSQ